MLGTASHNPGIGERVFGAQEKSWRAWGKWEEELMERISHHMQLWQSCRSSRQPPAYF